MEHHQPQGNWNCSWDRSVTITFPTPEEIEQNKIIEQQKAAAKLEFDKKLEEYIELFSFSNTYSEFLRKGISIMRDWHKVENALKFNKPSPADFDITHNELANGVIKYITDYHFLQDNSDFIKLFWECRKQFFYLDFNGGCRQKLCRSMCDKRYEELHFTYFSFFQRVFFDTITIESIDEHISDLTNYFEKLSSNPKFKPLSQIREKFNKNSVS